jgi:hypothetical protein
MIKDAIYCKVFIGEFDRTLQDLHSEDRNDLRLLNSRPGLDGVYNYVADSIFKKEGYVPKNVSFVVIDDGVIEITIEVYNTIYIIPDTSKYYKIMRAVSSNSNSNWVDIYEHILRLINDSTNAELIVYRDGERIK